MSENLAVVGSGAIACGLAAAGAQRGGVVLWARSAASAARARTTVDQHCGRFDDPVDPGNVTIVCDLEALGDATAVVEAVIEDIDAKRRLWATLAPIVSEDALLASTTSSLSVQALAEATGAPERFAGLHVFHPVTRMRLVELAFPEQATPRTRGRALALCEDLGKTAVAVPDIPGFVVNRLLFPYLFGAVFLLQETGLEPEAIDTCMQLGAGHPMGPLALLDYVGLDIAQAIGHTIGTAVPTAIDDRVAQGHLGRKTGRGFYAYD